MRRIVTFALATRLFAVDAGSLVHLLVLAAGWSGW